MRLRKGTWLNLAENISPGQLPEEIVEQLRSRARSSFYFFAKGILGFNRLNERIHFPICKLLEDYETNTRLRVILPRGWFKTTICSIAYPIWRAIRDPNVKVLISQNTHTNAVGKLGSINGIFKQNELFQMLFPELLPDANCVWTKEKMCVRRSGVFPEATFEAAGIRTQITSRHYDVIIEDDTVAPDKDELGEENLAPTKDDIEHAIGYHRLVTPLLTRPERDQILVVGTRWFEKDLLSWIGEREKGYKSYIRSCREDKNGNSAEDGEITFPEEFSEKVLRGMEEAMGPYMFSCLYLNKPVRSADMTFQPEWWQYYDKPPSDLICYTSVDLAPPPGEDGGDTDYNVVATCGKSMTLGIVYVLEYWRARANPGQVIEEIVKQIKQYNPVNLDVESVAYQKSMCYWINERFRNEEIYCNINPVTHGKKSKTQRISGLQPLVKKGVLRIRPYMRELLSEAASFPYANHDDVLDAISVQLPSWGLTRLADKPRKPEYAPDPHTLEGAMAALREERLEKNRISLTRQVLMTREQWKQHYAMQGTY